MKHFIEFHHNVREFDYNVYNLSQEVLIPGYLVWCALSLLRFLVNSGDGDLGCFRCSRCGVWGWETKIKENWWKGMTRHGGTMLFGSGIGFMIVFIMDLSIFHMFFHNVQKGTSQFKTAETRLWWLFHGCDADCRGGKRAEYSGDLQLSSTRTSNRSESPTNKKGVVPMILKKVALKFRSPGKSPPFFAI